MATSILEARAYVGTYHKYNNGSIFGAWISLADYTTKRAFLQKCKELHKDERDPEFMYQDTESIPTSMYGESYLSDEIWHVINSIKKYAPERADEFAAWCEDNGAEQDYNALREFMGYGQKKDKQTKAASNPLQMDKDKLLAIINEEYKNESESMLKYYRTKYSNAAYIDGKLVLFEKPSIKTQFPFDDEDESAMSMYHEFGENSKRAHDYFIMQNMEKMRILDFWLDDNDMHKPYHYKYAKLYICNNKTYHPNMYDIVISDNIEDARRYNRNTEYIELTAERTEQYHKLLLNEKAEFEKRLQQYLKRYGVTKCHAWSYWANA